MKLKFIYTLMLGLFIGACSSGSSETTNNESEAPEEVVEVPVGEVAYTADTTALKGYFAVGEGDEKRPGVLVIHEWWGHNEHSRERADMLAELGYVALALDMYGDGKNTKHPEDAGKYMTAVTSNMEVAVARFESALDLLKSHPNVDTEKIGVIGFCFGGTMALSMANAGYDLDAVAAFHAGLGLPIMPDSTGSVKAKLLVANGKEDPWISEEQASDFQTVMESYGVDLTYISYDGAKHGFTNKGADALGEEFGLPLAYNAAADSASWEELKALFSRSF